MKDYSEIVEALRACSGRAPCYECPYCGKPVCADKLNLDAAEAIEELVKEVRK
ncbi:MAG: hypothetical protein IJP43_06100 [Oscillospiraceae bacterium]|nr:hypothetical protein [Oscillospiraceae bacterium]